MLSLHGQSILSLDLQRFWRRLKQWICHLRIFFKTSNLVFSLWCFAECGTQVFDSARCTCFTITVFLIELVKLSFDLWCCTCFMIRFPQLTNHIIDLWRSSWCGYHNFSRSVFQKLSVMYCGIHCVKPGSSFLWSAFPMYLGFLSSPPRLCKL